jgi:SAM-dependent methyltransferase
VTWDGDDYQHRFDALAAAGHDVHGEASFVAACQPGTVLDAGCGTGRVAIELAHRGITVAGVDIDGSMIAVARRRAPNLEWHEADLTTLALDRTFDVVVMAGNVPLFTPRGTVPALVQRCAQHTRVGGLVVAGFQTDQHVTLADYDDAAAAAGLEPHERFATWDRRPFEGGPYAVFAHRRL